MVISVVNTNISESSINDLFHKAEISVLELCHEYELDIVRSRALNEADEGDEDKTKDSKFAKFIETIKLKIEEFARKFTDTVRKILLASASIRYVKSMAKLVKKNNVAAVGLENYIEKEMKDFKFYTILKLDSQEVSNCETVEDFMKAFENYRTKMFDETGDGFTLSKYSDAIASGPNVGMLKYINDTKKATLKQINEDIKNKSISKEESIKNIKAAMNWYTASLKSMIFNTKALIRAIKEYTSYLKKNPDKAKNVGANFFEGMIDNED